MLQLFLGLFGDQEAKRQPFGGAVLGGIQDN